MCLACVSGDAVQINGPDKKVEDSHACGSGHFKSLMCDRFGTVY